VPVGVTGTEGGLKKMFAFQRPKFSAVVGEPFRLPPLDRKNREKSLQGNTDEIMCQIAVLLPPKYRGTYANHPRLKDLLKNNAD
jgi:1-acyl-sn-glycerol-3-phosphate acyltransferase